MGENNKINYEEVMRLGFVRINIYDSVFEHQHGFPYFIVDLDIGKISFHWSIFDQHVEMLEIEGEGDIKRRKIYTDLKELKCVIEAVKEAEYHRVKVLEENEDNYYDKIDYYFNESRKEDKL